MCDQKQLSSAEDYAFYDENAKKLLSNQNSQNFQDPLPLMVRQMWSASWNVT